MKLISGKRSRTAENACVFALLANFITRKKALLVLWVANQSNQNQISHLDTHSEFIYRTYWYHVVTNMHSVASVFMLSPTNTLIFLWLRHCPPSIRIDSRRCYWFTVICTSCCVVGTLAYQGRIRYSGWSYLVLLVYVSPLLLSFLTPSPFTHNYHLCLRGTLFERHSDWMIDNPDDQLPSSRAEDAKSHFQNFVHPNDSEAVARLSLQEKLQ